MNWFKNIFLPSFERGRELNITEKQFAIFEKYLKNIRETGYLYIVYDMIDNLKVEASEWNCLGTHRFYLKIQEV